MRSIVRRTRIIAGFAILVMLPLSVLAKDKTDKRKITDQEQRLSDYSQRARQAAPVQPATVGSLWASGGLMTNMAADYKARNVNDLITIRISEATTATAQASVKTARTFNASSGVSAALGSLSTTNRLQNIFSPNSSQNLTGSGQTASTSALQTSLGGHVVDVLPNGVLVVQAEREIEMNNERQ